MAYDKALQIRLTADDLAQLTRAAVIDRRIISDWARLALLDAADQVIAQHVIREAAPPQELPPSQAAAAELLSKIRRHNNAVAEVGPPEEREPFPSEEVSDGPVIMRTPSGRVLDPAAAGLLRARKAGRQE